MNTDKLSKQKVDSLKIDKYRRHIFFCSGPKCCSAKEGDELWEYLKFRLKELGIVSPGGSGEVFRTKACCLRICCDGPIAIVYPEGSWYRGIDRSALNRIIDEHLIEGRVVEDFLLVKNKLIGKKIEDL